MYICFVIVLLCVIYLGYQSGKRSAQRFDAMIQNRAASASRQALWKWAHNSTTFRSTSTTKGQE